MTHEHAVVAYYVGGSSCVEQNGRWTLGPGDALLVPAGTPHRVVDLEHAELWGVGFCVPCFAADDPASLLEPFERVRAGASAVVHIPEQRRPFLLRLFEELRDHTSKQNSSAAVDRSLLTLILNEVSQAASWPEDGATNAGVVGESLKVIERRCLGPLTLADVARAVHRSPAYVTTALRRATGKSAVEWIIAGRMAEARRHLLHSDERVDIIAERVGYADPTHFIRIFRREHGQTPAAWRAERRSK